MVEIERALAEKRIDVAVHSLKDMPTVQPEGLRLLVPGPREDARDVLITRQVPALDATPPARIGTCSLRRTAQIRMLFPQAEILPLRGNVDTRLRKLDAGEYDAIILAAAGLHRLFQYPQTDRRKAENLVPPLAPGDSSYSSRKTPDESGDFAQGLPADLSARVTYLSFEQVLPAPGQGALGLELRDEPELLALLEPLNDRSIQATTSAERGFMRRLGAGCYLPVAAYTTLTRGELSLSGLVTSLDGREQVRVSRSIFWAPERGIEWAEQLGSDVAEVALAQGADAIIAALSQYSQTDRRDGENLAQLPYTPVDERYVGREPPTTPSHLALESTIQEQQHV